MFKLNSILGHIPTISTQHKRPDFTMGSPQFFFVFKGFLKFRFFIYNPKTRGLSQKMDAGLGVKTI